jgi:Zn-dependent peptidase ImmA (M78 family)
MPRVSPAVLEWARTTAGYDLETAARRIGLNQARGLTGGERLALIERGEVEPSDSQLGRMAKQYRRPLLTFFLQEPPRQDDVGEDFRTLPERADPANAILATLLREIKSRQSLARELLEDDEDREANRFIGSQRMENGVARVADAIARDIEFSREAFRAARTYEDAFNYLRGQSEKAGAFVVLAGSLGSWQTAIDVSVFRGFAITDPLAPLVVINDQDAKTAWSFTLLHELAHLWLNAPGVSGPTAEAGIEQFCNQVAAAILVPPMEINALAIPQNAAPEAIVDRISEFADVRRVSRSMVAYQLYVAKRISRALWQQLSDRFRREWIHLRQVQREAAREGEGGPNWYVVRRHRIGNAMLDLVRGGVADGSVTPTRAAKILGVKPMSVYGLLFGITRPRAA